MNSIAIIGGGPSGCYLFYLLKQAGLNPSLFEKARGLGGRTSTRYTDFGSFDHGTSYLVKDDLSDYLYQKLNQDGLLEDWHDHYMVITPTMNAICKHMVGTTSHCYKNTRIDRMMASDNGYVLNSGDQEFGPFSWVLLTAPAPQTLDLIPKNICFYDHIDPAIMLCQFTLMLAFKSDQLTTDHLAPVTLFENHPSLSQLVLEHTKPQRENQYQRLSCYMNLEWSKKHQNEDKETVTRYFLESLDTILPGIFQAKMHYSSLHRWLYARAQKGLHIPYLMDSENAIAACGDWCKGHSLRDAFDSAESLAQKLIEDILL